MWIPPMPAGTPMRSEGEVDRGHAESPAGRSAATRARRPCRRRWRRRRRSRDRAGRRSRRPCSARWPSSRRATIATIVSMLGNALKTGISNSVFVPVQLVRPEERVGKREAEHGRAAARNAGCRAADRARSVIASSASSDGCGGTPSASAIRITSARDHERRNSARCTKRRCGRQRAGRPTRPQ